MAGHPLDFDPLPSVNPSGAPGNSFEQIHASPEMFGALIGRAEEGLGQGIESVADTGLSYMRERQHLNNEISASETNTWLAKSITDKFNDFGRLQGRAAQDARPQFNQDLEDLYKQSLENAGDSLPMKAMLARTGRYLVDSYYRYAANHADTEWRRWQTKTYDDRATEYGNQAAVAAQHGTWDDVNVFLNTSNDEVAKKLEAQGWSREDIEPELKKRRGVNVRNIVETLAANGDPRTANAIFEKYKDQMDAASVLAVTSRLKSDNARLEGNEIADQETGRQLKADTHDYLKSRSGSARVEGVRPEFADRLSQAGRDYEAETGGKAKFESLKRTTDEQAEIYQRHLNMPGGIAAHPAAPPGSSRHERGEAADIPDGPFLDWMHKNASRYGLEFLKGQTFTNDPGHIQLASELSGSHGADKAAVYDRIIDRTRDNPLVQSHAISRMNQIFSVERSERMQDKVLFQQRVKDTVAEAHNNGTVTNPLTEADFVRLPNMSSEQQQEAWGDYQDQLALGSDLHAAASMSAADREKLVPPMPQPGGGYDRAIRRRNAFLQGLEKLNEERKADPATYAVGHLPDAKAAFQGMVQVESAPGANDDAKRAARANFAAVMRDEQIRVGVDPADVKLLPKETAAVLNRRFATVADDENPQARSGLIAGIRHEANLWGEHWPDVMRQLAPQSQPIVRAISAGADPIAMTRLLAIPKDENPAKILKEQSETKFADVTSALNTAFTPFRSSMVGRQMDRDYGAYYGLGEKLAALYVRDGDDASHAADKAFKALIGDRYEFRDTWRMPRGLGLSGDDVQAGTLGVRQLIRESAREAGGNPLNIAPFRNDIGLTDNRLDSFSKFARDGRFVTDPKNRGLNLFYDDTAVRTVDGKPLLFTWADLAARGGSPEAKRQLAEGDKFSGPQP